ncbi:MAG: prepilin-type N-terminal cleavage/methylation domain-containing protein [Desulfobacterium sp.]|jgi:prepilin-type N-terminal cleavage/methylation domain-containing protein|nr:prepilin-type N-terminal cleavage/methylation domain-containing protein [Desulfobacterium sp.]
MELKQGALGNGEGFTLIEVLIAMLVMSVGLLTLGGMQVVAIKSNSNASNITTATALIEEKLDVYKSMDYTAIVNENGSQNNFDWNTSVAANTPANGLKTITVNVSWTGGNKTHSLAFGTIVAQ